MSLSSSCDSVDEMRFSCRFMGVQFIVVDLIELKE